MKKMILFLLPLLLMNCLGTNDANDFDNSADIEYLEDNANEEGVIVTDSGLQYRIMNEGDGEMPDAGSTVRVNYTGWFINGQIFDSTDGRGPAEFAVDEVIDGWTEGLQLMEEGSIYEFVIPSDLAYGNQWVGQIYPGATLRFEVELIEILE